MMQNHAAFNVTDQVVIGIGESPANRQLIIDYNDIDEDMAAGFLFDVTAMTSAIYHETTEVFFVPKARFKRYSDIYFQLSHGSYVTIELV